MCSVVDPELDDEDFQDVFQAWTEPRPPTGR